VVHIAVEMAPIAKVGGMGDVVTALARAVQEEGNDVEVIIPKYDCIHYNQVRAGQGCGAAGGSFVIFQLRCVGLFQLRCVGLEAFQGLGDWARQQLPLHWESLYI
jgi:hypothetical protein